jgi:hypothetical protein
MIWPLGDPDSTTRAVRGKAFSFFFLVRFSCFDSTFVSTGRKRRQKDSASGLPVTLAPRLLRLASYYFFHC